MDARHWRIFNLLGSQPVHPDAFPPRSIVEEAWIEGHRAVGSSFDKTISATASKRDVPSFFRFPNGERLELYIFDNLDINAYATTEQGLNVVGISNGLIYSLPKFCFHLWANPNFAPWIGDTRRLPKVAGSSLPVGLEFVEHSDPEFLVSREYNNRSFTELSSAMCVVRRSAFERTLIDGFRYIWLHELGHIIFGHDRLREEFERRRPMDSLGRRIPDTAALQYMEYQADWYATDATVGQRLLQLARAYRRNDERVERFVGPKHIDSIAILTIAFLAVHIVLQARDVFARPKLPVGSDEPLMMYDRREQLEASHPPMWLRVLLMINQVRQESLELSTQFSVTDARNLHAEAVSKMHDGAREVFNSHPSMARFFESLSQLENGEEYFEWLSNIGGVLQPMILKHFKDPRIR